MSIPRKTGGKTAPWLTQRQGFMCGIKAYIDNGGLHKAGFPSETTVDYVSFDVSEGRLRLLLGGTCFMCRSVHIRDVCNCKHDLLSVLEDEGFGEVKSCDIVKVTDGDFQNVVTTAGREVQQRDYEGVLMTKEEWSKEIFYLHPLIDATYKIVCTHHISVVPQVRINRSDFLKYYYCAWVVDESTSVVLQNRRTKSSDVAGMVDLQGGDTVLPVGLTFTCDENTSKPLLVGDGRFYNNSLYQMVMVKR